MTSESLRSDILHELHQIPVFDAHSHIATDHPQVRDVADLLFYHFIRRELYAAGLPDDEFLVSGAPIEERINAFLAYQPLIAHTTTWWCLRQILGDLFEMTEELDEGSCRTLQERIARTRADTDWPGHVMQRAGVEHSLTCEGTRRPEDFSRYPFLYPLFEDLERFSFDPSRRTSVLTLVEDVDGSLPPTLAEFEARLADFFHDQTEHGIRDFVCFVSPSLVPLRAARSTAERAYQQRRAQRTGSPEEHRSLTAWLLRCYLEILRSLRRPAQLCLGAWWARPGLRYGESYVWADHRFAFELTQLLRSFPDVQVTLMCAAEALSQELLIMARMLPQVSLLGTWWHTLFPEYITRNLSARLEALPANKWIAVGTDAYSVEWAYAKVQLTLRCLARVLADKIEDGSVSRAAALAVARRVLYENPREIYGIE